MKVIVDLDGHIQSLEFWLEIESERLTNSQVFEDFNGSGFITKVVAAVG